MALHLHVLNEEKDAKTTRTTRLTQDDNKTKPIDVFYEFDRIVPWHEDTPVDGNVFGVLLYAMSVGQDFHVHGPVTYTAMRNLEEFQDVWARWRPDMYTKIDIIPERIIRVQKNIENEKAIAAFSGGVDAIYTALRHTQDLPEKLRYPVTSTLLVHGMDVDVYNYDDFNGLKNRVKPLLDELGLELRTVRSNTRELRIQDWSHSPSLQLAACLYMLGEEFAYGLIGSSYPYEQIVVNKGATPITDNLIRGDHFSIIHDGCGAARTDKIKLIAGNETACDVLKVCWKSKDQSVNCGECEKCIRTRMNFWAIGYKGDLPCFPDNFDLEKIKDLTIQFDGQYRELKATLQTAHDNGVSGAWMDALQARLDIWEPTDAKTIQRQRYGSPLKNALKKVVIAVGLEEPVKKAWRSFKRKYAK